MKITLFIFILIFAFVFFLMALAKGNVKYTDRGELEIAGWCVAGFCALGLDMLICFVL